MGMRALVKHGDVVTTAQRTVPRPGPGQVLVRVRAAGVCRTDLRVARGELACADPVVLGHELGGEIQAVGAGVALDAGTRVSAVPWHGAATLGIDVDGAFATHVLVHREQVVPVPSHMDFLRAAYVEPVAAALGAAVVPARRAVVLGDGRIAELTARVLRARGVEVSVAMQAPEAHAELVVEARADADVLERAIAAVAPGGTVLLKSRADVRPRLPWAQALAKRVTLRAVGHGSFADAVALLADPTFRTDDLFGPCWDLGGWRDAFAADEARKVFLLPD